MKYLFFASLLGLYSCQQSQQSKLVETYENYFVENNCLSKNAQIKLAKKGLPKKGVKLFAESLKGKECSDQKNHIFVDFNKPSNSNRFYVINVSDKDADILLKATVAHGVKSGGKYATKFSNKRGSNMSSLGIYKIQNKVIRTTGKPSLPVKGLDKKHNSNAWRRFVTIHQARYVNKWTAGRSKGCFAISSKTIQKLYKLNVEGGYLFAYHKQLDTDKLTKR